MEPPSSKCHINYFTLIKHNQERESRNYFFLISIELEINKLISRYFQISHMNDISQYLKRKFSYLVFYLALKNSKNQSLPKLPLSWNVHFLIIALRAQIASSNYNFIAFQFWSTFRFIEIKSPSQVHLEVCLVEKKLGQKSFDFMYYQQDSERTSHWQWRKTKTYAVTWKFKDFMLNDFLHI
jgi:hypothetical protein